MKHVSFLGHTDPVITAILSGATPEDLIMQARDCESDGAQGIAINLADLKPTYRNTQDLRLIINSLELPFMFFFYRDEENLDDDARQAILLAAVDAGAAMIDIMGDLYDPSDGEITYNESAISKQKCLIKEIHDRGAEIVISSHLSCARTTEQVIEHLRDVASRGADVVKIVTTVDTQDELVEAIRTSMALNHQLDLPFIHLCNGSFSRLHRYIGPKLGAAIVFAIHQPNEYGYTQPRICSLKSVIDTIDWNIHDVLTCPR